MSTSTIIARLFTVTRAEGVNELAAAIGISIGYTSKLMHERCSDNLGLGVLRTMSQHTGVPVVQLVEWWLEPSQGAIDKPLRGRTAAPAAHHNTSIDQMLHGRGATC